MKPGRRSGGMTGGDAFFSGFMKTCPRVRYWSTLSKPNAPLPQVPYR